MRGWRATLVLCLLTPFVLPPVWSDARQEDAPAKQADTPAFLQTVRPLLQSYCFECHNANKRKAGLNLEKIETEAEALELVELWGQVGERVTGREMPPSKSKQPGDGDRAKLLAWV